MKSTRDTLDRAEAVASGVNHVAPVEMSRPATGFGDPGVAHRPRMQAAGCAPRGAPSGASSLLDSPPAPGLPAGPAGLFQRIVETAMGQCGMPRRVAEEQARAIVGGRR